MNKRLIRLRGFKWWLFGGCIILVLFGLVVWASRNVTQNLNARTFRDYILLEYMPSQHRNHKKWPSTLNGLIEQVNDSDNSINRIVLQYYQDYYIKIEPVQECKDSYVYRLFTKNGNTTCKVTVNPNSGYCWHD